MLNTNIKKINMNIKKKFQENKNKIFKDFKTYQLL